MNYEKKKDDKKKKQALVPQDKREQEKKLCCIANAWRNKDLRHEQQLMFVLSKRSAVVPCYYPIEAYRSVKGRDPETGKWPLTFKKNDGLWPVTIACGQCIGCRLERSRKWAMRCVHEAQMHEQNCFITLTYNDEHLSYITNMETGELTSTLVKRDWQLFMKRLRKEYVGIKIRFYMAGEYGEKSLRPHYHACIFGFDFPDKKLFSIVHGGHKIYVSESLSKIWGKGFCTIGDLNFQTAAYVARYIMKKQTGYSAAEHYNGRTPEFTLMSRADGIGKEWIEKYHGDVYPHDILVINKKVTTQPPKYYDRFMEKEHPDIICEVYEQRRLRIKKMPKLSADRLYQKMQCKIKQISKLKRSI